MGYKLSKISKKYEKQLSQQNNSTKNYLEQLDKDVYENNLKMSYELS